VEKAVFGLVEPSRFQLVLPCTVRGRMFNKRFLGEEFIMNENPTTAEEQFQLGKKYIGCEYIAGITIEERDEKAMYWLTKAAEQGHAEAQYRLGLCYENGEGVSRDMEKAVYWLTKAAEQNHHDAQVNLAWAYKGEDQEKANYWDSEATKQFKKAAEQGNAEAMYKLYNHYNHYNFYDRDLAAVWLIRAAEQGHAKAQCDLAEAYKYGSLDFPKTLHESAYWYKEAAKRFAQAAEQGDAEAMYRLSNIFYWGSGLGYIPQDEIKARNLLFKSADCGYLHAQYITGYAQQYGWEYSGFKYINQNIEYANNWYTIAANRGHIEAQYHLGINYIVAKDLEKGNYWLAKAAEQGYVEAQYRLGVNCIRGIGVAKDLEKGIFWLTKAAEKSHHDAQIELANFYSKTDVVKSHYWKDRAELTKKSGCYIATCVYGSYDCPEVWTLRRFRDDELSSSWLGRQFIRIYYAVSPKIVELFGNKKWFSRLWKPIINKIVRKLQNNG
jgi:TPR repeat protein